MAAGDIARRLKLPQNTLSFHLAALARANLVASRKEGRSIIYFVDLEGTRGLLSFLVEDCCGGKAELRGCLSHRRRPVVVQRDEEESQCKS